MTITASVIIEDIPQADGRRAIRQQHTDQLGLVYFFTYLCPAGFDANADLAVRATQLAADLATNELQANLTNAYNQIAPTFVYCTVAQFRALVRSVFATLTSWQVVELGKFINSQNLTDAQLAALWGYANPSTQLTNLKTKLANLASNYDTVIAQAGV